MALAAGTRLGSFEILAPLGVGGMGEVYRARDTKLGREVALKILPEAVSGDPERLARFGREAHLLASLNHPNVATIHGLEESAGQPFLVMELVEGETLAERLLGGPLPIDEALPLFEHIAEGLEAAHERGIVHRDLKPANVKIARDGKPKILDFGLAKALAGEAVVQDLSQSPTLTRNATDTGVVLGTAPYMSPEQARGKLVDKRTDVWSFGCCLYEALTGRAAFLGETVSDTIGKILEREPDWPSLPSSTPALVRSLLRRCLRKDAAQRLHDIADARIELQEARAKPDEARTPVIERHGRWWAWASPVLSLILLAVGGAALWLLRSPGLDGPRPVTRFEVTVRPAERLGSPAAQSARLGGAMFALSRTAVALSPDGTRLVYVGAQGESSRLYLRSMDRPEANPVPGTEGGLGPFFSPDGEWVGFWADGKLMKVSLRGGPPVPLCSTPIPFGASWGSQGTIVFGRDTGGLMQVSADAGIPTRITELDVEKGDLQHGLPHFLPGGEDLLFTVRKGSGWEAKEIQILSLASGKRRVLIDNAADARYIPTGYLVFARVGALMAVAFDVTRLETQGGAVGVVDGVLQAVNGTSTTSETGAAQFALSDSGTLVYVPGGIHPDPRHQLVWVGRGGDVEPLKLPPRRLWAPRLSPDGVRVAMNIRTEGNDDIWVYDLSRATLTRLTSDESREEFPLWSPEGTRVAFLSNRPGSSDVYWMPLDGTGAPERLTRTGGESTPSSWTPDGATLAFTREKPDADIWLVGIGKGSDAEPFLETPFNEGWPTFSPDGRFLAYTTDETGREEIYVQPYPGPGGKVQVSSDGGRSPLWAPNGKELFYRSFPDGDGVRAMMAVDLTTGPEFRAGSPRVLFRDNYISTAPVRAYDVAPDGQHFLMIRREDSPPEEVTELHVVLNWSEELKRLVPSVH